MRYVIGIFIALFIFGCKGAKQVTRTSTENREVENSQSIQTQHDVGASITQALQKILREKSVLQATCVEYDTGKPVNPDTGKHPVKAETTVNLTKETDMDEQAGTNAQISQHSQSNATSSTLDKSIVEHAEVSKRGLNTSQKALIAIGVIALLGVAAFVGLKLKKIL